MPASDWPIEKRHAIFTFDWFIRLLGHHDSTVLCTIFIDNDKWIYNI